jgi:hypothetical protein
VSGDWTEQVKMDLEKIKLTMTLEAMKMMSKEEFQKVVKVLFIKLLLSILKC